MLSAKLSHVTPSYTVGISNKVRELTSEGKNIINLSIGEPDFYTPPSANDYAIQAISDNKTKYDVVSGIKPLREAIALKLLTENNVQYNIDEIVVSSGAKHALTNTLIALLNQGDEVLIPKPFWVSYSEMVKLVGGVPKTISTDFKNSFKLTSHELESHISPKTKILLINNPSNPTGAIYTQEELQSIADICIKHGIYIISDEIYEALRYDSPFTSMASLSEDAKDITITINGLSKSAAMTGWRIGYTASNKEIAQAISTIQGHLVSHPSTISQWAALGALKNTSKYVPDRVEEYRHRRDLAINKLSNIPNIKYVDVQGAFYIFVDISEYKEYLEYTNSYSVAFCEDFLDKQNVAIVPGIAFGNDDYIRLIFCTDIDDVLEGINRFHSYLSTLKEKSL